MQTGVWISLPPFCPCLEEAICLKTSSSTLRRSCSHIPTFSTHHSMIPKLYVMPWRQDMKNQRLLLKVTQKESKIQLQKGIKSDSLCACVLQNATLAAVPVVPLEESLYFCNRERLCHSQTPTQPPPPSLNQAGKTAHHSSYFSR